MPTLRHWALMNIGQMSIQPREWNPLRKPILVSELRWRKGEADVRSRYLSPICQRLKTQYLPVVNKIPETVTSAVVGATTQQNATESVVEGLPVVQPVSEIV